MDQIKIGKFISEKRKAKGITQSELAEKLFITDRAISKWENGVCLPDASNIIELCKILDITVNDLFSGEVVDMKDYNKVSDDLLLEMKKREEQHNKKLITSMWILLITLFIFYISIVVLAYNTLEEGPLLGTIICASTTITVIIAFYALKLEVDAGYYECKKCHHRFVPTYFEALISMHLSTTRYLKCPECHKRSWAKKVMSK